VPDERLGEEVGATICCISPISEDELRRFLKGHLSAFKIPRYLDFTGTLLPRTGSGKIFKLEIRKTAIERFFGIHK
jgi:acyl-CoA synthetase (AMP-forming)/AMP-acid ligase II